MNPESFPVSAEFDKPREKCGIAGVYYFENQDETELKLMLGQLQHRGQEGAGISLSDHFSFTEHTGFGTLQTAFEDDENNYKGRIGNGQLRYSTVYNTKGRTDSLQPLKGKANNGYEFRFSHNGNIPFLSELSGSNSSDSEVITERLVASINEGRANNVVEALRDVLPLLDGAYSLVISDHERLIGVRDPRGVRPLALGRSDRGYYLASETPAFKVLDDVEFVREIQRGEIVVIDEEGIHSSFLPGTENLDPSFCIMEHSYFARKDSMMFGESNYRRRLRMGAKLYEEAPAEGADYVVGVPGTGLAAAIGYSHASGLMYHESIEKPTGTGRSFIGPDKESRELIAKTKLFPVEDLFEGKSVVVIDDTIVRGNITHVLIDKLWSVGVKEIHFRVAAPPYVNSCHYGLDTGDQSQLIARGRTVDQIREYINATTLQYLSLGGFVEAIGVEGDPFCTACLTGDYPTPVPVNIGRTALRTS